MRKIELYLATAMLILSVAGCSSSVDENPTTTVVESDTSIETMRIETFDSKTTTIESEDTSEEGTSMETEETDEVTSEETKETTKVTVKETTVKETTAKETTVAPTTVAPTKKPEEEKPIKVVKAVSVSATVNGTHCVGDTLTGSDFTITVKMSDGKEIQNPSGWAASPLKLTSTSNEITVTYGGLSCKTTATATEKPAQPQPQPQAPSAGTYSGETILDAALDCMACPYVLGGTTKAGFDCSGFVAYCYAQAGIKIPTGTVGQKTCGTKLDMWDAQLGDIVVTEADGWIHTAIYGGFGMVYEAREGQGVLLNTLCDYFAVDNSKTGRKIYAIRPGNNTAVKTYITVEGRNVEMTTNLWLEKHGIGTMENWGGKPVTLNGRTCDLLGQSYIASYWFGHSAHYRFENKAVESTYDNSYMFTNIW